MFSEIITREADEIEKIRKAFVERPTKPTLEQLSDEFDVPRSTIGKWSANDGWNGQRVAFLERQVLEGDALQMILEATGRVNRPVIAAISNAILSLIQGITQTIEDVDPKRAPSTRAQVYNTCSFAIKNASDACKQLGIVGFPKELTDLGKSGQWTPQLAQQININLGDAMRKAQEQAAAKVEPAEHA